MATGASIRFNRREFDETLRRYRALSSRDPATITNTKGFYIMRRATVETVKRTKAEIKVDLMQIGRLGAPLAALIVNAMRRKKGLPGLTGRLMEKAVSALIRARKVASLAAGWIPGIKTLEPLAEKRGGPRQAPGLRQLGTPRGYATPAATGGLKAKTIFANLMTAKWDTRDGAEKYAEPGLEKAFAAEQQSMLEYIERKYRETAKAAGVRTN